MFKKILSTIFATTISLGSYTAQSSAYTKTQVRQAVAASINSVFAFASDLATLLSLRDVLNSKGPDHIGYTPWTETVFCASIGVATTFSAISSWIDFLENSKHDSPQNGNKSKICSTK